MHSVVITMLILLYVASAGLLISGSPMLGIRLTEGLPLGTIVTWAGLTAFPLAQLVALPRVLSNGSLRRWMQWILFLLLAVAILWGIISFALAGTWSFNFSSDATGFVGSDRAGILFWQWTTVVVTMPWVSLGAIAIGAFLEQRVRS